MIRCTGTTQKLFDDGAGSAIMRALFGQVAQLVEQRIENPRVGGSIPPLATKTRNGPRMRAVLLCPPCCGVQETADFPRSLKESGSAIIR